MSIIRAFKESWRFLGGWLAFLALNVIPSIKPIFGLQNVIPELLLTAGIVCILTSFMNPLLRETKNESYPSGFDLYNVINNNPMKNQIIFGIPVMLFLLGLIFRDYWFIRSFLISGATAVLFPFALKDGWKIDLNCCSR